MTGEGTVRILTATSTAMAQEAARVAGSAPAVSEALGDLLTGVALLELAQSPVERVQCSFDHDGSAGQLVADVWPGPEVRGRVKNPQASAEPLIGTDGELRISRHGFRGGQVYQSRLPVSGGSIAGALQQFCLESEQTLTLFSLATVTEADGRISRAGGMIVQAMPDCEPEHLAGVTACLEQADFAALVRAGEAPADATTALLDRMDLHVLGHDPLLYQCRCSLERAVGAVRTLSPEELDEVRGGRVEEVVCDFCSHQYLVGQPELDATAPAAEK
jgi:molecular chaperone Hsp33